jgi:predicted acetyltransferase
VTRLLVPDVRHRDGLLATIADFGEVELMHGSGFWHLDGGRPDTGDAGLEAMVGTLRSYGDPAQALPDGMVHSDYFWIADDPGEVIGFIAIRHALNDFLLEEGGHIGYSIRPARRREGHASRALGLALDRAGELGIERTLVTCDDDNEPSRRTIERNGGVYEDTRKRKLRYWFDTAGRAPSS